MNHQSKLSADLETNQDEIDISEVIGILLANIKWLVLFLIIGIFIALFVSLWSRPVFQSDALIQLDTQKRSTAAMGDMMSSFFEVSSPAETEIELITSRDVLMRVVESEGLTFSATPVGFFNRIFQKEGRLKLGYLSIPEEFRKENWQIRTLSSNEYELLDPYDVSILTGRVGDDYRVSYGGDTLRIRVSLMLSPEGQKFIIKQSHPLSSVRSLKKRLNVAEKGKKTGIIAISLESRYADDAAALLNAVTETYLRKNIEMRSAEAEKTLGFLEDQLPSVKAALDSAEKALTAFRHREGTVDLSGETRIVLEKQVDLQKQLLALEQQKQDNLRLFKEDHPTVQAVSQQQERLQKEIGKLDSRTKTLPLTQQEFLTLQQEVQVNNSLYTSMVNNIQQLRVVRAGEIGNVRIVDHAQVEIEKVKPRRKLIFMGVVAGSLIVGIGFIFIRRLLNNGVRSSADIENEAGVAVYAKVPEAVGLNLKNEKGGMNALVNIKPDDVICEALRILRTALEFSLKETEGKGNVVMITGISPGVGKSFISTNLSLLFIGRGKKVLLIDADLRRSRLTSRRKKGLTEILHGKSKLEDIVENWEGTGLSFIGAGTVPPNPSELLAGKTFIQLVETARTQYDLVVIDTPPVLFVTDAQVVAPYVDFILLVLHYGVHSMPQILETLKTLSLSSPDKDKAIVLNRCISDGGKNSYGYGYGYGYKYSYKSKKS